MSKLIKHLTLFIIQLVVGQMQLNAQKVVSGKYTYTYVIPKYETLQQAEQSAIRIAQDQMIASHFGTMVSSTSTMVISDIDGKSDMSSFTVGDVEVRGEWLSTNDTPVIIRDLINGEFVLTVTVSGTIREIKRNFVDFRCRILRNGEEDGFESDSFVHGDYMYLSFRSPVNGYVSIFITDGKYVQCLFPYAGMGMDDMAVDGGTEYLFFSKKHPGNMDPNRVQKVRLGCSSNIEHNRVFVVFSPNKYSKPVDRDNGSLPRELDFGDFNSWLSRSRQRDLDMNVKQYEIVISKQ